MNTDPAISELLSFFEFDQLPPRLADVSTAFYFAAHALEALGADGDAYLADLAADSPGAEGSEARFKVSRAREALRSKAIGGIGPALRLLLEAKDCAVRAAVVQHRSEHGEVVKPPHPSEPAPSGTRWVLCWSRDRWERRGEGWRWWAIDEKVADVVRALQGRLATKASCHGHRPGELPHVWLEDGRVLVVLPDMEALDRVQADAQGLIAGRTIEAVAGDVERWADLLRPGTGGEAQVDALERLVTLARAATARLRYPATFHVWADGVGKFSFPWRYALRLGDETIEEGSAETDQGACVSLPPALRAAGLSSCKVIMGRPGDAVDPVRAAAVARATLPDPTDVWTCAHPKGSGACGNPMPCPDHERGGFTPPTGPAEPAAHCPDGPPCEHWAACVAAGGCAREK